MDRVLRNLLVLLILLCGVLILIFGFNAYVDSRYAKTLTSEYTYQVTLVTDAPLTDLHLFIPLPGRVGSTSEVVRATGSRGWTDIPEGWNLTLTGTEKYNLLEITTPGVPMTGGCSSCGEAESPLVLTVPVTVRGPINTTDPVGHDEVLKPRRSEVETACTDIDTTGDSVPRCTMYETRFFADYSTYPTTTVKITVDLTGTNRWNIFSDRWSEFQESSSLTVVGESHGWQTARGELVSGLGYASLW